MKFSLLQRSAIGLESVERVFDALADALLLLDAGGAVMYSNPAARRLLGAEPGLAAAQLVPSLGAAAVEWLQRALRAAGTAGAPPARLDDGRSARLTLLRLDARRFALHVQALGGSALPAAESAPMPLAEADGDLMRSFGDSPFPTTVQDLDFRFVAVNRAFIDFTGFPDSMLVGLDPLSLQPEEDRAVEFALRRQMKAELDAGKPPPLIERRLVDAAGRERWFRAWRRIVRDAKGRTLLLSVMQDATDEHQSRAQSDRLLLELGQWFDLCPHGMVLIDAGGLLVRSNAAFEALVGAAPVALADAAPALRELLGFTPRGPAPALRPGAPPLVNEALLPRGDGSMCKLRATLRRTENEAGEPHVLALIEDRGLEDQHEQARLQLGALVDVAGVGLATFHESLGWLRNLALGAASSSPAAASALRAIGRDIVEPASLPDFERLQRALRDGERAELRYAVRHPDIGLRWLLTRVEPGAPAPGPRMSSVVTLDITEQQLARARSDELVRELAMLFDSSSAGIAVLRGDRLLRCNRRFERLLGAADGALAGASLAMLARVHPRAADLIAAALRALDDVPLFETEFDAGVAGAAAGEATRWFSLSVRRSVATPAGGAIEASVLLSDITQLKTQQAELQRLAADNELLFESPQVGMAWLRDGIIERANAAFAQLSGYAPDALAGLEHAALFEDRAEYLRISAEQRIGLAQHGRWSGERRLERADGTLLWVQASKQLRRAGDAGAGMIASYVSVDERHQAEESLLMQSERTRAILDSALVGIVSVGASGAIEWMNRSARRMFGGTLADFIDQPLDVVATGEPDHPFRRIAQWLATLEDGAAHSFDCRISARDGRVFCVAGNAVLTGRDSLARQLTVTLLDIDRRRMAEASSAQTQAFLRRIIEMAPLAIARCDAATLRVLALNPLAAGLMGRVEPDRAGRAPPQPYAAEPAGVLRADMRAALDAGETVVTRREYKLPGAGGEARIWDMRYQPLATVAGQPPDQLLAIAADVTEQRAAEAARLEAAIEQRERPVRGVDHSIQNDVQGVAGLLQQVAQRRPEVAPVIGRAIGQVQAIAQVYGLQVGADGSLGARSVVDAIVASVARLHGRPIAFEVVGGSSVQRWALPEAESIPIALALNELLNNALEHASDGEIGCSLACGDAEVGISISNPGALPEGFDLARVAAGASGLALVRALLPRRGASLSIANRDGRVVALVALTPPAVLARAP